MWSHAFMLPMRISGWRILFLASSILLYCWRNLLDTPLGHPVMADEERDVDRQQRQRECDEGLIEAWPFAPEGVDDDQRENGHNIAWLRGERLARLWEAE